KVAILKNIREKEKTSHKEHDQISSLNDLREVVKKYEQQNYKAGETIYEEGRQGFHFYFIDRGVVKSHKMDQYGKELITSIYKEGDFFGNTSLNRPASYEEYATAMEDTRVYAVTKDELKEILSKNNKITLDLIDVMG